jgi:hypothetical protein
MQRGAWRHVGESSASCEEDLASTRFITARTTSSAHPSSEQPSCRPHQFQSRRRRPTSLSTEAGSRLGKIPIPIIRTRITRTRVGMAMGRVG